MGILSDRGWHRQQRCSVESTNVYLDSDNKSNSGNWRKRNNGKCNFFVRCYRLLRTKQLHNPRTWSSVSIYPDISRTRDDQPDNNTKINHRKVSHRHNFNVYSIGNVSGRLSRTAAALCVTSASLFSTSSALAEGVGGVSATANPIANSSGSVTNQAIQVLQGPYVTNTYGGGVSCQGTTLNMTPYLQFADSRKDPWEDFYNEPQYNLTDLEGRTVQQVVTVKNYPWETWYDDRTKADGTRWFEDGDDIQIEIDVPAGDGVPDVVGSGGTMTPTWYKPIRTDMRANQSFNVGISATLSIPLNRGMQRKCSEAATAQIASVQQLTANKRLDFELARLKNCGELKKAGIMFHPASPYHAVCADVMVSSPGNRVLPHEHEIPQPTWTQPSSDQTSEEASPSSLDTDSSSSQIKSDGTESSQESSEPSQSSSLSQASQLSITDPQWVLQVGQTLLPPQQSKQ